MTIQIINLDLAVGVLPTDFAPIQRPGEGASKATLQDIANLAATGLIPDSTMLDTNQGITGGGLLASGLTLSMAVDTLTDSTSMAVADSFAINKVSDGNLSRKVTFPNAMKAISGLPPSGSLNLSQDKFVVIKASDGEAYSATASEISLATGNVPAGGTTGQFLVKASDANYDTEWSSSSVPNQSANTVFAGPTTGPDAEPAFRLLVGGDLPNPAASSKGGVNSYAAVTNQFLTQIGTDGSVASAQPSAANLSNGTTGTGAIVLASSATLTTPDLGTPTALTLTNATGLPLATGVTGVLVGDNGGTGVANTGKTITVSGNTTIGSNTDTVAFATTGNTSVTLPTSGTLATTTDVPSTITVANEATDTSCFLGFFTAATGNLGPKTNANMTFNSNTGVATFASTVLTTTDINGGTVDGAVIGGSSAAEGTFTSAVANSFVPNLSTVPSNGMYLPAANTLGWSINSAAELQLTSTALSPAADGGSSLGTTALGWQNLFANTGFVLNIENGNWVATHTSGILTVGTGDLRVSTAGTNTASVVTVGGNQTLTSKTLTSPTITTSPTASGATWANLGTVTEGTFANTGLHILDSDASHDLIIAPGSNLTADRTLTLNTGDANASVDLGAWTSYTPTVTAVSGTFTSVSATGRYARTGKVISVTITVTITTNGTAATATNVTMPVTAASDSFSFSGRENAVTGALLVAWTASTSSIRIQKYDGTYIGGNGYILVISGSYEAA